MFDLNEISCFVKVVQLRSVTQAARALGLPKSTVSRKLASLEKRLKVTLLSRTTRSLSLTKDGAVYFARLEKALAEMEQAEKELHGSKEQIAGLIKVTAPVEFGSGLFLKALRDFQKKHPEVFIELLLSNNVMDLVAEGIDLALRIDARRDSSLLSKKIGGVSTHLAATPAYLKKFGIPQHVAELKMHRLLTFFLPDKKFPWVLRDGKKEVTYKPETFFGTNNFLTLKEAALNHQGIAVLPAFLIQEELKNKELQLVLPQWKFVEATLSLLYPSQRYLAPKTRALIDHLADVFKNLGGCP